MATRGYIAKVEQDGSGRHIYLGHCSDLINTGQVLLEHYQEPEKVDALLDLGAISHIEPEINSIHPYYPEDPEWTHCQPTPFTGGTGAFFLAPYHPGPEWLYCWTPDGWLAAPVYHHDDMSENYFHRISSMTPDEFQDWFDNNQQPEWTVWRKRCLETQRPQPLLTVIADYTARHNAMPAARKRIPQPHA